MDPSKGMEEKDNPVLVFSGETKDCPTFKDAIQMRVDKHDTTWLFEGGRSLAEFLADRSRRRLRAKALEREVVKNDSNHVTNLGRCIHHCLSQGVVRGQGYRDSDQ